jgi:hypothetical protein
VASILRVHQEGLLDRVTPRGPLYQYPARVLLGLTDEDRARIAGGAISRIVRAATSITLETMMTEDQISIPLIYTTEGNLPMDRLEYSTSWEEPKMENGAAPPWTKLIETYRLDGKIVRQSAHVLHREGVSADAVAGKMN